jgi:membrane-associated phospholipid phosphatase
MVGVGGLLGSLLIISFVFKLNTIPVIAFLFLLSGLIASSRLYLKAHSRDEIYSGFALGMFTQVTVFLMFLKFNFI